MKFRTECEIKKPKLTLNPENPVIGIGSCFAENITLRMRESLWDASNPLGVLFNPISIARAIRLSLLEYKESDFIKQSIFCYNKIYHSWLADSGCSSLSAEETIENLQNKQSQVLNSFKKGKTLIITFGTAYCYSLADDPKYVVANCHKMPNSMFSRFRMSVEGIVNLWRQILNDLKNQYGENLKIIFTVSPVRHIRDGLHENNISKSILLLSIEELCNEFDFCEYFPAYEIINDDLRDYRFYSYDLVHPSQIAIDYVWEKFKEAYLDAKGIETLKEGEKIVKRLAHRPIVANPDAITKFMSETMIMLKDFQTRNPHSLSPDFIAE